MRLPLATAAAQLLCWGKRTRQQRAPRTPDRPSYSNYMRLSMKTPVIAALLSAASIQLAYADVGYESPAWVGRLHIDNLQFLDRDGGMCSSCQGEWAAAERFSLTQAATISGVDLLISRTYGSNWSPTVSIWDASRSHQLYSQTIAFGTYATDNSIFSKATILKLDLNGPRLEAGSYYMSWYEPVAMAIPTTFIWPGQGLQQSYSPNDLTTQVIDWAAGPYLQQGAAFQVLTAPVPEPSTYALMTAGLAVVGVVSRRRARRASV